MAKSRSPALIHAQMIETQYQQARNNILAENVVLIFMLITALQHNDWRIVLAWAAAEIGTQIYRTIFMLKRYASGWPEANFAVYWARHHAIYQTGIGFVWGATMFLFGHAAEPITILTTVCGLVIITSGAVPGLAYNQAALRGFVIVTFGLIAIRLLQFGTYDYTVLAAAMITYAGVLILMGSLQSRVVEDGIRIRFENIELLSELRVQTDEAVEARAEAEQASLAKSQFLAAASHDLRQPLYALSLFSESLVSLKLDDQAQKIVASIQSNIGAMEGLFNGLLDISRLDAGAIAVNRQAVSVDALFARIENVFGATASERELTLRFRSNGEWLESDPALIEQIVSNLVSNALRHTTKGGVLIAARVRLGQVILEIWDTGPGIADTDQQRIFDDFVQLGNPERDRRKGLGLGLAIAQRAATLLGTKIGLTSRLGLGSVFRFSQPNSGPAPLELRTPSGVPADMVSGLRVLIIDDEPDVRAALALLLAQWGVVSEIVATAEEALARIAAGTAYDVVLTDHRLGGAMTGLDLLREIRSVITDPPASALITGDMDGALIITANQLSMPILHKPVQPSRLRALLNHLVVSRRG